MENREEIYSERVRAGKRTYFFDVKMTQSSDYYLTITESKKLGDQNFEKHKLFIYSEDFEKFQDALNNVINHINTIAYEDDQESDIEMDSAIPSKS